MKLGEYCYGRWVARYSLPTIWNLSRELNTGGGEPCEYWRKEHSKQREQQKAKSHHSLVTHSEKGRRLASSSGDWELRSRERQKPCAVAEGPGSGGEQCSDPEAWLWSPVPATQASSWQPQSWAIVASVVFWDPYFSDYVGLLCFSVKQLNPVRLWKWQWETWLVVLFIQSISTLIQPSHPPLVWPWVGRKQSATRAPHFLLKVPITLSLNIIIFAKALAKLQAAL